MADILGWQVTAVAKESESGNYYTGTSSNCVGDQASNI